MELHIDGGAYSLTRVRVRIACGACVTVRCRIAPSGPAPSRTRLIDWRLGAREAVLRYAGRDLPLLVTGFDTPAAGAGAEVHLTPAAPGTWSWLGESVPPAAPLLVYQRQEAGVDPTAWAFVRRLAGYQLAEPEGSLADRLEPVIDAHACFPRAAGWNNLDFLDRVIAFLGERVPDVLGWCGFGGPGASLRLVTRRGAGPVVLDGLWKPSGESCRSARPGRNPWGVRWSASRAFHPADPAEMLGALCTRGRAGEAGGFGRLVPPDEASQVVALPGTVAYRGHELFCRRAEYTFLPEPVVTAEIRFGVPRPSPAPGGARITGLFADWVPNAAGPSDRVAVGPRDGRWAVLATRTPEADPDGRLWVEILQPVPARAGCAGLSARYEPGDEMRIAVQPGRHPGLCGHPQHRRPELERNELTLNAPTMGFQTSDAPTAAGAGARFDATEARFSVNIRGDKNFYVEGGE